MTGTNPWTLGSIEIKIPSSANNVSTALYFTGSGNAWFDDFRLVIDGKKMEELPVAAPFSKKQIQWLNHTSSTINSVDATSPGQSPVYPDLKNFGEIVGDATIIGLGEATHGTSEFFRLKHRLLEYAVRELGVRVFAIEDNQLIVEKVNNYVLNGVGKARNSMYGMFSVWQNQEVFNMIKWVRAYNVENPNDKVEFVGFDMQNPVQPLDSLYGFLQRRDTALLSTISSLLYPLKKEIANTYMAGDSSKYIWLVNTQTALATLKSRKQDWLANATSKKDTLDIEWGVQYANLLKQFAQQTHGGYTSLYRDTAMAENIAWILSIRNPGTKIVVWAHDVHISRGEHPLTVTHNYHAGVSMGSHLARKYGNKYKAFGIFTYTGEYTAQVSYSNFNQISCPTSTAPQGSLDEALHQVVLQKKTSTLLLDLRGARKIDWLVAPLPTRFANHTCVEYGYWTRFSIPFQFDGVFFVDKTNGARLADDQ